MGLSVFPAPEDAGVVGPTGATGPQGPPGAKGAQGDTGPAGPAGPKGDPGPKGDTGATGPQGPKGDPGSVDTVNGKAGPDISLSAADVGAVANTGGYSRTDGMLHVVHAGSSVDVFKASDASQSAYTAITKNAELVSNTNGMLRNLMVGTSKQLGYGDRGVLAIEDAETAPTASHSRGVLLYAENGIAKVRQGDGTVMPLGGSVHGPPGEFVPEDLGLVAWAFDPATAHSTPMYCGTTPRLTAVRLTKTTTVSKIVWHFVGYAGGLTSGSWAAIYNTSMARVAVASSIDSGNEPAEQHGYGGNASATTLDSAVTLPAGIYYVVWRFNYNTSTGDGPMILGPDNSFGAPSNTFGLNNLWRFGRLTTSPTSAPSTLTGITGEANRFWVALA